MAGKRKVAAASAPEPSATLSTSSRILLVNSGPTWLEVQANGPCCTILLNHIFGPGITLQTVPAEALTSNQDSAAFGGAVATAASPEAVAALLPGPNGELTVVANGAYNCVRLFGSVRAAR